MTNSPPLQAPRRASLAALLRSRLGGHGAWLALFAVIFGPTLLWLVQRWTISVWHHAHGVFIPFALAFMIRDVLRQDASKDQEASPWGFLIIAPALALTAIDSVIKTRLLSAFALVLCLPGLSLLLLGARRTKALAFPWIIAFFMLPIPAAFIETLHLVLRQISATGSEQVLSSLGISVLRDYTTLRLGHAELMIAEACSGFSTLYFSVTVALYLAHLSGSWRRRTALVLAAVPCAIAANIVRCALLALWVDYWGYEVIETWLHPGSGVLSFALAILALIAIAGPRPEPRFAQ